MEVLENMEFMNNSDDFVFDTRVLFQIVAKEYNPEWDKTHIIVILMIPYFKTIDSKV